MCYKISENLNSWKSKIKLGYKLGSYISYPRHNIKLYGKADAIHTIISHLRPTNISKDIQQEFLEERQVQCNTPIEICTTELSRMLLGEA